MQADSHRRRALAVLLLLAVTAGQAFAADTDPLITHKVEASFDVPGNTVTIVDRMQVPAGLEYLRLGVGFTVTRIERLDWEVLDELVVIEPAEDEDGPYQRLKISAMGLNNGGFVALRYHGQFLQPVEDVEFSRENVGGEITATIGDEGIYLSAASEWLAWSPGTLATYEVSCSTPEGFETVTQGRRTQHDDLAGRLQTRWVAAHPSDGLNLIANRFVVHEDPIREGLTSYTFFLEDDPTLRETYFERTRAYIQMYEEMIGPYPYAKFATVENWFPTGYGMPSYTLLGGQVLRLPFIPFTSFGHEIAHNWWGNSVFVDTDEGNWCEGLTSYCADYHYKNLESAEAGREYRRNLLKDYAAYVKDPALDFPLSQFKSRHSGATRAVGYGKSMMVFHMIERLIGRDAFVAGMQQVAADFAYRPASWSDFLAAFASTGGIELEYLADQWLRRTGAPRLELGEVEFTRNRVRFRLTQDEPRYRLQVPVVLTTATGDQEHLIELQEAGPQIELEVSGVTKLAIDPDCHLFRHLHAAEIEPTLRQVLAAEELGFASGTDDVALTEAARGFAAAFTEDDDVELSPPGRIPSLGEAAVVINPSPATLKSLAPTELFVSGRTAILGGKRLDLKNADLVFAAFDPDDPERTVLVVVCDSAPRLPGLARRIVHYGKYSWLVLPAGQGRVERGNWQPGDSPLVAQIDR